MNLPCSRYPKTRNNFFLRFHKSLHITPISGWFTSLSEARALTTTGGRASNSPGSLLGGPRKQPAPSNPRKPKPEHTSDKQATGAPQNDEGSKTWMTRPC